MSVCFEHIDLSDTVPERMELSAIEEYSLAADKDRMFIPSDLDIIRKQHPVSALSRVRTMSCKGALL